MAYDGSLWAMYAYIHPPMYYSVGVSGYAYIRYDGKGEVG